MTPTRQVLDAQVSEKDFQAAVIELAQRCGWRSSRRPFVAAVPRRRLVALPLAIGGRRRRTARACQRHARSLRHGAVPLPSLRDALARPDLSLDTAGQILKSHGATVPMAPMSREGK